MAFTVNVPKVYREGYGVAFVPVWDEDTEQVSDVISVVVEISPRTVWTIEGMACVADADGCMYPVDNFRELDDDLDVDDTHDLRDRWFATEDEARDHERDTMARYRNPLPWESFLQLD